MPEFTKTHTAAPPLEAPAWAWISFAGLILLVSFSGLTVPLMGPDEPRYAQVAREMYESGDWLTPTLGGYPWFEKPPLLYWLQAAAFSLFGIGEFAARLGPAVCGLGTVAAISMVAKAETLRPAPGFTRLLAIIAASTLGLIVFSHAATSDIVVTFALTAALAGFFIFDRSTEALLKPKRSPLFVFYTFVGIAVLAKGLIGVLFPFAIASFYYSLSRQWPPTQFLRSLLWGVPLVLIVAAPWHLVMYERHGGEFFDVYLLQNHFERFTTNRYLHPQPFYFFLWVLPFMTLPWLPFFAKAVAASTSRLLRHAATPLELFCLAWIAVPLVFFSFSGSKLPGYILPAVPAAAILTASFVFAGSRRWRNWVLAVAAATLVVASGAGIFVLPGFAARDSVKDLIDAASAAGYGSDRVLMLHMISHNAEYYAASRLTRNDDGTQQRLEGAQLVAGEIEKGGGHPVLVFVPTKYVPQLTEYDKLTAEVIRDNGEIAIVAVAAK